VSDFHPKTAAKARESVFHPTPATTRPALETLSAYLSGCDSPMSQSLPAGIDGLQRFRALSILSAS